MLVNNISAGRTLSCYPCRRTRGPAERALADAIGRCHNPKHTAFKNYGARGISVCSEWRGPGGARLFAEYLGPRPSPQHTVDRINTNRGYEPGNVRWASVQEQARNKVSGLAYARGRVIEDPADAVRRQTLSERRKLGWSEEEIATIPRLGAIAYGRTRTQKTPESLRARLRRLGKDV